MSEDKALFISLVKAGKSYRGGSGVTVALCDACLDVEAGDFVGVCGPSGSGKSTLLSIVGCMMPPSEGEYFYHGENVALMSEAARAGVRRKKIGFVFQDVALMPGLRVWENVALPAFLDGARGRHMRTSAAALLEKVGLEGKMNSMPADLSHGQLKRVEIARALIADPELILADEPTGGLDKAAGEMAMNILQRAVEELGKTVIFVTHDEYFAAMAKRRIEIRGGRLV